jgi:hypothetical protein
MMDYAEQQLHTPYDHLGPLLGWADAAVEFLIMEEAYKQQLPPHENLQKPPQTHHLPENWTPHAA